MGDPGIGRIVTVLLFLAILGAILGGCATPARPAPEPIIRTVEVQVPVPVPCDAADRLGPSPAYPDTDAAVAAAPDLLERVRLLLAGRVLRIARLDATEGAIRACQ